jgi:hypothetical protein
MITFNKTFFLVAMFSMSNCTKNATFRNPNREASQAAVGFWGKQTCAQVSSSCFCSERQK